MTSRPWRRQERSGKARIGVVTLFREDLEEIVEQLSEAGTTVQLLEGGYEYSTLGDIRTRVNARPLHALTIVGQKYGPAVTIDIGAEAVTVEWPQSELVLAGAASGIVERLRERERPRVSGGVAALLAVAAGLLVISTSLTLPLSFPGLVPIFAAFTLVAAILVGGAGLLAFRGPSRSTIYLVYESEVESNWRRNRDVLIAVGAAIVGSVLTLAGETVIAMLRR